MSSGGKQELACSSTAEGEKGQGVLIAGCFAINHAPECQLVLTLKRDVLLINPFFPTKQPHHSAFPITSDLAYRITLPMPTSSQNPFWLLQLRNGKTEMALRSVQFDSLEMWRALLKRYVYKFGFWEDFKPLRRISKGTSSAVYEVLRVVDGKKFAVKAFWKTQFQQNIKLLAGLEKEIKVLREINELRHSHLLGIEEVYDSDSSFYIVMQLCGKELLKGRVGDGDREEKVRQAMRQLLSGITVLHNRGMVHRDIKPNNIMFREDGRFELVITDFGLAMHLEEDNPFVQCGTPGFIAPQVFLLAGSQQVKDCACDVFSMGVVFHILLTGQPLFKAETPKELFYKNSKMDFDLTQQFYQKLDPLPMNLLRRMLQLDSKDRITAEQALKHEYFSSYLIKMKSPAPTFQSYNQSLQNNQQQFSQIDLGAMGRKRHKGEYRKASHR